jgi:pimeloyl-ACP methyl ester carboxylesterase
MTSPTTPTTQEPKTIVLIHGLWLTSLSWEGWVARYQSRGFRVIAENWPGMEGDVAELRKDHSRFDNIGLGEVADHYDAIIRKLDAPPIIMGHSMGGAVAQILLDRGLGSAGVAIDPAPIKGVLQLPLSTFKSALPALKSPANNHRAVMLTPDEFHYAFTNTMTAEESKAIYDRQAVPGPGRTLFQAALANFTPRSPARVDFRNAKRAPLLVIVGTVDHVAPPVVARTEAHLQRKSGAVTAYKEFAGRSHYQMGQPGWEEVADFALEWGLHPRSLEEAA